MCVSSWFSFIPFLIESGRYQLYFWEFSFLRNSGQKHKEFPHEIISQQTAIKIAPLFTPQCLWASKIKKWTHSDILRGLCEFRRFARSSCLWAWATASSSYCDNRRWAVSSRAECRDRGFGSRGSICSCFVVTARYCVVLRKRERVIVSIGGAGNAAHVHWTALSK